MSKSIFSRYRPREWSQLIGHAKLKRAIQRMRERGSLGGRAFLLSGASGIGKSTAAYLIAQDVCDADNIVEINATVVMPKMVQDWSRTQGQLMIGKKPGRAIIVNECHKLRTDVVTLLLEVLEDVRDHCVWIFTTQGKGQMGLFDDDDSGALESRCVKFELTAKTYRVQFAEYAMEVAATEGLDGAPLAKYLEAADKTECNLRAMLSMVEAGEFMVSEDDLLIELQEMVGVR